VLLPDNDHWRRDEHEEQPKLRHRAGHGPEEDADGSGKE
jgi:hypothetical protein